jgi:hypothetical protein
MHAIVAYNAPRMHANVLITQLGQLSMLMGYDRLLALDATNIYLSTVVRQRC